MPEPFGDEDVAGAFADAEKLTGSRHDAPPTSALPPLDNASEREFEHQAAAYARRNRRKTDRALGIADECDRNAKVEPPPEAPALDRMSARDLVEHLVRIANRKTEPSRLNITQATSALMHVLRVSDFAAHSAAENGQFTFCSPRQFTAMVHEWADVLHLPVPNGRTIDGRANISFGAWRRHNAPRALKQAA